MGSKERLNIYLSPDLLNRLEFCANHYGVSRTQLAVVLIGQGVAGIEKSFNIFDNVSRDIFKEVSD